MSWLLGGKENQERYRRWVSTIWVRNQGRKRGKLLVWVCFFSGLILIILKFGC